LFVLTAQWRTPIINHQRAQIESKPTGTTGTDQSGGVEDNKGLVIWHENYPFGKFWQDNEAIDK